MHWNTNVLQFTGTANYSLTGLNSASFGNGQSGTLTVSWDDADFTGKSLTNGANLFSLLFTVIGAGGTSSAIQINDTPLSIELTDPDLNSYLFTTLDGTVTVNGI